ncbi:heme peroxidase [Gymnopilus junonius]|uniref:Peroxidase n=1 Tax=Gymnopilus junonius TaxID=109634 RepID=A0A9P5NI14_GYMJU|nr:heme peroxidase [Gymnopilus junonius]
MALIKKALFALVFALPAVTGLSTPQKRATCSDGVNSAKNAVCCNLFQVREDILDNLFENECGDSAHGALRLIFHDAIGIDPKAGGGGADGSIATFNATELTFPANSGIDDVLDVMGPFILKWAHVLTPGDFIQFAGALSLSLCPGAPQVKFVMGRPVPKAASPPNLVPNPFDSVDTILARFGSVGFSPEEVIALLSSHSIAGADDVDPSIPGTPFDISPAVYDSEYRLQKNKQCTHEFFSRLKSSSMLLFAAPSSPARVEIRERLSQLSRVLFVCNLIMIWLVIPELHVPGNPLLAKMASEFGAAVFKMSLLGQNQGSLTDCSDLIPAAPAFTGTPSFPPSLTISDVEQACSSSAFPKLPTQPGPPLVVPPIPQADGS